MKDRVAKSVFWIVWSKGGVQLISLMSTLFVARLLSPSDYGLMALAGVWIFIMGLISEVGLGAAIIQFHDLDEEGLNLCFWITLSMAIVSYAILFLAAPAIASWFSTPALVDVLRVVSFGIVLTAIRVVPESILRKHLAYDKLSQAEIVSALGTIPVVLTLAMLNAGVWALVAAALVQQVVLSAVIFGQLRWFPGFALGFSRFKELASFSLTTLGTRLCWAVYQQTDNLVIGKVLGEAAVGSYSIGKQLATLPVEKFAGIVTRIATPVMAEIQRDRALMARYFLRSVRLIACISVPASAGIILMAETFVVLALGEKWAAAVPIIKVLSIYSIFCSLSVLVFPVLTACYRVQATFHYTLGQMLIMPVAVWVGASWHGTVGAAIAWTVFYPLALTWLIRVTLKEIGLEWAEFFAQFRAALVATTVMVLTVGGVRFGLLQTGAGPTLVLAASMTSGVLAYGLGLMWSSNLIAAEIAEVAGWLIRLRSSPREKHA